MITPFNRVRLFTDSSSEAAANVREALMAHGIPYAMRTRQSRGALGRAITAGRCGGQYMSGLGASAYADRIAYVYVIYVRRRDEARAREACSLQI